MVPIPLGQLAGAGKEPRLVAFIQASFSGGDPPGGQLVVEHGGGTLEIQVKDAAHPGAVTDPFERNTKVRHPLEEVKIPGLIVPEKIPKRGAKVLDPL